MNRKKEKKKKHYIIKHFFHFSHFFFFFFRGHRTENSIFQYSTISTIIFHDIRIQRLDDMVEQVYVTMLDIKLQNYARNGLWRTVASAWRAEVQQARRTMNPRTRRRPGSPSNIWVAPSSRHPRAKKLLQKPSRLWSRWYDSFIDRLFLVLTITKDLFIIEYCYILR